MKVYVAARYKRRDVVRDLYKELEELGYKITLKWTDIGDVKLPYRDNLDHSENRRMVEEYLTSAQQADIFILISEPAMRGAYVELGAFLTSPSKAKQAYIVGGAEQQHVFESHPSIIIVDSKEELLERIRND